MSEYEERDVKTLLIEELFLKHVEAMTDENLHSKAAIAAELAWRDHLLEWAESMNRAHDEKIVELMQLVEELKKHIKCGQCGVEVENINGWMVSDVLCPGCQADIIYAESQTD